jgi:hypothetical protein
VLAACSLFQDYGETAGECGEQDHTTTTNRLQQQLGLFATYDIIVLSIEDRQPGMGNTAIKERIEILYLPLATTPTTIILLFNTLLQHDVMVSIAKLRITTSRVHLSMKNMFDVTPTRFTPIPQRTARQREPIASGNRLLRLTVKSSRTLAKAFRIKGAPM